MPDNWHIVDVIYLQLHVAALPRHVTVIQHVLFCKLINVDILLLYLIKKETSTKMYTPF